MSIRSNEITDGENAGGHYERLSEAFGGGSPYTGEIQIFAGNFAPENWALCTGLLLPIASYPALFALLGTTYGGNGTTNFGIPDLQGRVAIHQGTNGVNTYTMGTEGGATTTTLGIANLPPHTHPITGTLALEAKGDNPSTTSIAPNSTTVPSIVGSGNYYSTTPASPAAFMQPLLSTLTTGVTGGTTGVNNMQPYTVLSYIICLNGVYPTT